MYGGIEVTTFSNTYHSVQTDPYYLKATAERIAGLIDQYKNALDIQAIACSGNSGQSMAYPVSILTHIPVIYVRKEKEYSHGNSIEGPCTNIEKYVIVDDFISTGKTMDFIINKIEEYSKKNVFDSSVCKCVGIFLYQANSETIKYLSPMGNVPIYIPIVTGNDFSMENYQRVVSSGETLFKPLKKSTMKKMKKIVLR